MTTRGQKLPRMVTSGLRQRAWWVLRARGMVTIPMLLSSISDGSEKSAHSNLSKYMRALEQAGFITRAASRERGQAKTSNGFLRYRLTRNNGRIAPVYRVAAREVFDPNTGEVFGMGGD